jgi:hypothetical protein
VYRGSVLFLLLIVSGPEVEPQKTGRAGEYVSGIAAGRVWEQDTEDESDLDGYRIAFTSFSQGPDSEYGFAGSWYLERKESRHQEILEGGVELSYPYFRLSRVGLGPRFRLAIQDRAERPHRGADGVFGVGFEIGVWLSERVQIAALADRSVGFEAGARNSLSMNMRIMLWND